MDERYYDPIKVAPALGDAARAVAGIGGIAAVVFGVIAIFKGHDGAGTTALLIIGAAFVLMAVTGYAITKIKAGDYEIVLGALEKAQRAFAQGDEEGAEAIVSSLVTLGPGTGKSHAMVAAQMGLAPPDTRAAAADAYAYQRRVLEVVVSILPPDAELQEREASLSGVDAFIEFPEGTRIGIEVRAGTRFNLRAVADRMSAALGYARPHLAGLIAIVRAAPDDRRAEQLRALTGKLQAPVAVVAWEVGDPDDAIREAIMNMIPRVR
jgi:hypothetical protein